MIPTKTKKILLKQHYSLVGRHSAVQICRWTKKSLRNEGFCYKEKFYGIQSHRCCQMTPSVIWCQNRCLHCWRAIEHTLGTRIDEEDSPAEIINGCIEAQKKLLSGFKIDKNSKKKQLSRVNMKKWVESQEPMQFAISLSGEPTIYTKIGGLINELRRRGKTSFLVTNGLLPERILELKNKNQLPTQLYVSVNSSNEKEYKKFHRSCEKDAWKKLNSTLEILPSLSCRSIFRINLIKDLNMDKKNILEFAELIKKAEPTFIELKGFMSVGFARQRLGYDRMPWHKDILEFAKNLVEESNKIGNNLKILDEHKESCAIVLGKNKNELRIKEI
jgi:tRNA wybutosine-synthesizing protein 1